MTPDDFTLKTSLLYRHQLVCLSSEAWRTLIGTAADDGARAGLLHWANHDLPLVVARQPRGMDASMCSLGVSLPACWGRRRLAMQVPRAQVARLASFPDASELVRQLGPDAGPALQRLCDGLQAAGLRAWVYGSHGWQWVTGLNYVHPGSDLDLLVAVGDVAAADAAAALMASFALAPPRLDGELMFADGTAVAWREWLEWRSGRAAQILLKRIADVRLVSDLADLVELRGADSATCA
jgi:phosphoribosyl-dephospho-CoA transferase